MDPAAFRADLELIPETLDRLSYLARTGYPGLDAVDLLKNRGANARVLIVGMGSSRYAADVVGRRYRAAGATVFVELASSATLPPPADDLFVVAVSATGGSVEVLKAVEPYRGRRSLIALTNRSDSALAQAADAVVPLHAGLEASGIACRTFRATFAALDATLAVLTHTGEGAGFGASALEGAALASRHLLETADEWLAPIADLLAGPTGTWVLAPVERFSSAQQSALMMREVPRRGAYASETGDWSHVDVYLTKTQDYRALIFGGSVWDDPAVEWMCQRGSRYASVGRDLRGAEYVVRYPGDSDDTVAALADAMVGELVADHWQSLVL